MEMSHYDNILLNFICSFDNTRKKCGDFFLFSEIMEALLVAHGLNGNVLRNLCACETLFSFSTGGALQGKVYYHEHVL